MSGTAIPGGLFVVERAAVKVWDWGSTPHFSRAVGEQGESWVPVAAYPTRPPADAARARLEAEVRAAFPAVAFFGHGMTDDRTRGTDQLTRRLGQLGLHPPRPTPRSYDYGDILRRWWAEAAPSVTPEQQAGMWELLGPDFALYRVVERKLED